MMVDYEYSNLFQQSSVYKQLIIETDDKSVKITNNELHQQKFELEESLCSENQLNFGSCESSSIKFTVSNIFTSLKDKWITVSMILDNHTNNPFQIGRYKVYSDIPNGDKSYREVTAYDALYDIINSNVSDWYNALTFPLTLKEFRDSFFNYFGIEQEEIELVNDSVSIEKTIDSTDISGKMVISSICELNGCFGHIGRDGKFKYVILVQKAEGIFPANDLYPSNTLYPTDKVSYTINENHYISCEYEDYTVQQIDKIQIRQKENDIGFIYGDGDNCYIIQNNFLVYGKSSKDLQEISENIFSIIKNISYIPFNAELSGNLCFEVGDAVRFNTNRQIVNSYILQRTMKGIQSLKDSFRANGVYQYEEKINSVNSQINQLRGKTNELERNVDETKSTITDVEKGLQTQITQNANDISLEANRAKGSEESLSSSIKVATEAITSEVKRATSKENELSTRITQTSESITSEVSKKVGKDEIISRINQSAESVDIDASKINLNGAITANGNVTIGTDGRLHAVNGEFEGNITSSNAHITKGYMTISGDYSSPSGPVPSALVLYGETVPTPDSVLLNYKGLVFNSNELSGSTSVELLYSRDLVFYTSANKGSWGTWIDETGVWSQSLTISGTKSREIKTNNYGNRLEYCYEMATPYFGDIGEGITDWNGVCYVFIDDVFAEVIDTNCAYQVFLQVYGEGTVYVEERNSSYFIVKGTENTKFGWEIKAVQKDYEMYRLDTSNKEKEVICDYATDSYDYLSSLLYDVESEVLYE